MNMKKKTFKKDKIRVDCFALFVLFRIRKKKLKSKISQQRFLRTGLSLKEIKISKVKNPFTLRAGLRKEYETETTSSPSK